MRVLLDENLPHDLVGALTEHAVSTVQGLGWAGTQNGALLKRASDVCDVFVSMDGNIELQQNLASLPFGVVLLRAPSNRMADLLPIIPELREAVQTARPGEVRHLGKSPKRAVDEIEGRSASLSVRARLSVPTGTTNPFTRAFRRRGRFALAA